MGERSTWKWCLVYYWDMQASYMKHPSFKKKKE